jgi:hypothetical protein
MELNAPKNNLEPTFIEELHPLMIKNGFKCEDNRIYTTDNKTKIVYKFKSNKFNEEVLVELICVPFTSFIIDCVALLLLNESPINGINTLEIRFNRKIETKQKIANRFEVEFIKKLIEILSIGINDLPQELLFIILDYLPFKSVVQLSQTNHFWHRICDEDRIWKKLFQRNFETDAFIKALESSDSWKQSFIN